MILICQIDWGSSLFDYPYNSYLLASISLFYLTPIYKVKRIIPFEWMFELFVFTINYYFCSFNKFLNCAPKYLDTKTTKKV